MIILSPSELLQFTVITLLLLIMGESLDALSDERHAHFDEGLHGAHP